MMDFDRERRRYENLCAVFALVGFVVVFAIAAMALS